MISQMNLDEFSRIDTRAIAAKKFSERHNTQKAVYLKLLADSEFGLTDNDASKLMKIPASTVCARRNQCMKKYPGMIYCQELVEGPFGAKNKLYELNDKFRSEVLRGLEERK